MGEEELRMNASDPDFEEYNQMVTDNHMATNPHMWHLEMDMPDAEVEATPELIREKMGKFHLPLVGVIFDFIRSLK